MYFFDADFFNHVYYINLYLLIINPGLCIDIPSYMYMVLLIDECFIQIISCRPLKMLCSREILMDTPGQGLSQYLQNGFSKIGDY